jgi:hypothetical protein
VAIAFPKFHVARGGKLVAETSRIGHHDRPHYAGPFFHAHGLFKCSDRSRGKAHSAEPFALLPRNPAPAMSTAGGFRTGGANGLGGHKRGHPLGSGARAKEQVAATPPVPPRRGHPPGSRNKKTLVSLAAASLQLCPRR